MVCDPRCPHRNHSRVGGAVAGRIASPTFGFIGKESLLDASLGAEAGCRATHPGALCSRASSLSLPRESSPSGHSSVRRPQTSKRAHEAPPRLWLPPMLLACFGILFGIIPSLVEDSLLRLGGSGDRGEHP